MSNQLLIIKINYYYFQPDHDVFKMAKSVQKCFNEKISKMQKKQAQKRVKEETTMKRALKREKSVEIAEVCKKKLFLTKAIYSNFALKNHQLI